MHLAPSTFQPNFEVGPSMSTTSRPTPVTGLSRTVIGPLTTTFTAPQQCNVALADPKQNSDTAFQAQTCYPESGYWDFAEATVCWPPATYAVTPTSTPFHGWGFYSPGLICPTGRSAACSATGGGSWGWPVQYSIYNAETAYGCCPSGFICDQSGARAYQSCISVLTSGDSYLSATCTSGSLASQTSITLPYRTTVSRQGVVSTPQVSTMTIFAPMIEIRWQSSDLPTTTSLNTNGAATASATDTQQQSSGVSTGAKIGIGVAVPLAVLSIILAAFLLWKRRRAGSRNMTAEPVATKHVSQPYTDRPHNTTWAELDTYRGPAEMAAKSTMTQERHELHTER